MFAENFDQKCRQLSKTGRGGPAVRSPPSPGRETKQGNTISVALAWGGGRSPGTVPALLTALLFFLVLQASVPIPASRGGWGAGRGSGKRTEAGKRSSGTAAKNTATFPGCPACWDLLETRAGAGEGGGQWNQNSKGQLKEGGPREEGEGEVSVNHIN